MIATCTDAFVDYFLCIIAPSLDAVGSYKH